MQRSYLLELIESMGFWTSSSRFSHFSTELFSPARKAKTNHFVASHAGKMVKLKNQNHCNSTASQPESSVSSFACRISNYKSMDAEHRRTVLVCSLSLPYLSYHSPPLFFSLHCGHFKNLHLRSNNSSREQSCRSSSQPCRSRFWRKSRGKIIKDQGLKVISTDRFLQISVPDPIPQS